MNYAQAIRLLVDGLVMTAIARTMWLLARLTGKSVFVVLSYGYWANGTRSILAAFA